MIKLKIILALSIIIGCNDIGENYNWYEESPAGFYRNFGTLGYDYGRNVAYSPFDNGIILIGSKQPYLYGQRDMWAIKTDERGFSRWQKSFGGELDEEGYDVISTLDGGYLFIGYSWSYGNEQQIFVVKTDIHGNTKWEKTYGGSMWDVGYAGLEVNGGGYIITGFSNSPGISSGNTDMIILKIDESGNQIWLKAYGNNSFPNHEWAYDIVETSEGYMLIGAIDRYDKGSKNILIVNVDKEGNLLWKKEYFEDENTDEVAYSITKSIDGFYYICSSANSLNNKSIYNPLLYKIDLSGNIIWKRKFNANGFEYHQYRANASKYDKGVFLVGSTVVNSIIGYRSDAFVMKIDSNGDIIWTTPHGTSDEDDWGWSIHERPDKNIIFIGSTKSYNASLFDIFLVGLNAKGTQ